MQCRVASTPQHYYVVGVDAVVDDQTSTTASCLTSVRSTLFDGRRAHEAQPIDGGGALQHGLAALTTAARRAPARPPASRRPSAARAAVRLKNWFIKLVHKRIIYTTSSPVLLCRPSLVQKKRGWRWVTKRLPFDLGARKGHPLPGRETRYYEA